MNLGGVPTKEEVLAIALFKLAPEKDDVVLDIGCGTGTVSLAVSSAAKKVVAIDRRKKAIDVASENIKGHYNIELLEGEAKELIPLISSFNKAFVGGTGDLEEILNLIKDCDGIVLNAARIEVASMAIEVMKNLEIFKEVLVINVAKSYDLAGGVAFKSLNPVFMVVGGCL
ncbi:MAG: precorrin-6Y C5,15-methyltransferase (decarboxylating) subunit CbiT [Candidatus Syntropharchaeales archaeon]